ncbi:MAG: glycerol-3-phosphate dehydrogenase/oxidase [Nitriliruptorales bacterium]
MSTEQRADPVTGRAAVLGRAARTTFDVIVVGGGINGVGILLDAATRGMRALLVERDDLAVGTSSRSSKLIHGGLRYLEHRRVRLVREALAERATLLRLAPHLVRLQRFVLPVAGPWWEPPYIGAGLSLYDLLGGRKGGSFRHIDRDELHRRIPALRLEGVRLAFAYSDGITDDARYVVAVARTAEALGADVLTQAQVTGLTRHQASPRHVEILDRLDGGSHLLRTRAVVDATGAFEADEPLFDTGGHIVLSRGSHLILRREAVAGTVGLTLRVPGRVVFLVPWLGSWMLGTTDVTHEGEVGSPRPTADEVRYLLDVASEALEVPIDRADVVGGFAGIRPLVGSPQDTTTTADLSREHRIVEPVSGLLAVRGGKFTTYRRVAAEVVDRVAAHLGRTGRSQSASVSLVGAAPRASLASIASDLVARGIEPEVAWSLAQRHGTEARDVARVVVAQGLTARLVPDT